jgi:WD40 repeat protein
MFNRIVLTLFICFIAGCNFNEVKIKSEKVEGIGIANWMSFNDDASLIAFGNGNNPGVTIYEVNTRKKHVMKVIQTWDREPIGISAAFHPTNKNIIAYTDQDNIALIDWKKQKVIFRLTVENGQIPEITFSKDGSQIIVVHSFFKDLENAWKNERPICVAEMIKIDIESQTIVDRIIIGDNIVTSVDFNLDCDLVAVRYVGGLADIWDLKNGSRVQSVKHYHGDYCIKFICDKTFLTDGYPGNCDMGVICGNIIWWDINTGEPIKIFNKLHRMALRRLGIMYDKEGNRYILSGGQDGKVILWRLDSGKIVWSKQFSYDAIVATSVDGHIGVISTIGGPFIIRFDF